MRPAATLAAYGLALAVALGGGAAAGAALGPIDSGDAPAHDVAHADASLAAGDADALPGGLQVADDRHRLIAPSRVIDVDGGDFRFVIAGADGGAVTDFAVEHDKQMHLIVAGRDLQTFHHLHPTMDDAGTWSVALPAMPAGAYRAFADFRPADGDPTTLGVDLVVAGQVVEPTPLKPATTASVSGFTVTLDGALVAGEETQVAVTVMRDGQAVRPEPYLSARGHLVALRDGDLAYLHVHPLAEDGTSVRFAVEAPSAGTYALFFDFKVGGEVHTAPFVLTAAGGGAAPADADADANGHDSGATDDDHSH